jgi:hypothetical protein
VCERFAHTDWSPFLERQAALVNPLLPDITHVGFPGYWWVIDQCEYASDVLFTDRTALETIRSNLMTPRRFDDRRGHGAGRHRGYALPQAQAAPDVCR